MRIRPAILWIVLAVLVTGILGAGVFLRTVPARPGQAIRTAEKFVDCPKTQELTQAYQLTTQRGDVGKSFVDFQKVVRQQWPEGTTAPIRRLAVSPFQSYGNRLRRWLQGQEVEMPEVHVEFSVGGMPFEVRERYVGKGEWKVSYFQAHAG